MVVGLGRDQFDPRFDPGDDGLGLGDPLGVEDHGLGCEVDLNLLKAIFLKGLLDFRGAVGAIESLENVFCHGVSLGLLLFDVVDPRLLDEGEDVVVFEAVKDKFAVFATPGQPQGLEQAQMVGHRRHGHFH